MVKTIAGLFAALLFACASDAQGGQRSQLRGLARFRVFAPRVDEFSY